GAPSGENGFCAELRASGSAKDPAAEGSAAVTVEPPLATAAAAALACVAEAPPGTSLGADAVAPCASAVPFAAPSPWASAAAWAAASSASLSRTSPPTPRHLATFLLCSSSVAANTCPPVPSATK